MEAPADGFAARMPLVVPVADDRAGALELALPASDGVAAHAEHPRVVPVGACRDTASATRLFDHEGEECVGPTTIRRCCYGSTSSVIRFGEIEIGE